MKKMTIIIDFLKKIINLDKIHNKIRKILINIKELMLGCLGQLKEFPQAPFLF